MPEHDARAQFLQDLIAVRGPISDLANQINEFPWDCDSELATVQAADLTSALRRFLRGELTARDIEAWADLIECRDDVAYASPDLQEVVHALATPEISEPLTHDLARRIIADYDETV